MSEGKTVGAEGESADKKVVFDSKDIGKKEKTEYFVKVEGAEARKKEAIKRIKAQKADIIKEEKAKVAAEKKEQKRQRREANRAKRRIKRQAFIKKYKILLIILGLLFAGAIVAVAAYFIIYPPLTESEKKNVETIQIQDEVDTIFKKKAAEILDSETGSYDDVVAWAKKEIEETDDNSRQFQNYSQLVRLAMQNSYTLDDCFVFLGEMEQLASSDGEFAALYALYSMSYYKKGNMEKYEEYLNKGNEYREKAERLLDGAV